MVSAAWLRQDSRSSVPQLQEHDLTGCMLEERAGERVTSVDWDAISPLVERSPPPFLLLLPLVSSALGSGLLARGLALSALLHFSPSLRWFSEFALTSFV